MLKGSVKFVFDKSMHTQLFQPNAFKYRFKIHCFLPRNFIAQRLDRQFRERGGTGSSPHTILIYLPIHFLLLKFDFSAFNY